MPAATTFLVAEVTPVSRPAPSHPFRETLGWYGRVVGCSERLAPVLDTTGVHTLLHATRLAFLEHRPLVLSPDVIWLTLLHGFATHVNHHAEALRPLLVAHSGRLTLRVDATDLVRGAPDDRWDEVFNLFSGQILKHIGPAMHEMLGAQFTTTGPVERAAFQVVLMDAFKPYFHYEGMCICGIPTITLEGTVDDWRSLRRRVEVFARYGLEWWVRVLRPILDQFVSAADGQVNRDFWHDIYQHHNPDCSYGGPYERMTGWVAALIPYTVYRMPNPLICGAKPADDPYTARYPALGLHYETPVLLRDFGLAISKVPVDWQFGAQKTVLQFVAGLMAIEQHPTTFALRPRIGWAVCQHTARG